MAGWEEPRIEKHGNTLSVSGELSFGQEKPFEVALQELVRDAVGVVAVDMTGVSYMSSSYVRIMANAMMAAKTKSKTVVVRANSRLIRLFQIGGLDRLGTLELVNGD